MVPAWQRAAWIRSRPKDAALSTFGIHPKEWKRLPQDVSDPPSVKGRESMGVPSDSVP